MKLFCAMASPERVAAGECLHRIPEKRAARNARFCSLSCRAEWYRQIVAERRAKARARRKAGSVPPHSTQEQEPAVSHVTKPSGAEVASA